MVANPKTSWPGFVLAFGCLLILVANTVPPLLHGDIAGAMQKFAEFWPALAGALAGLGLVGAKDGGA